MAGVAVVVAMGGDATDWRLDGRGVEDLEVMRLRLEFGSVDEMRCWSDAVRDDLRRRGGGMCDESWTADTNFASNVCDNGCAAVAGHNAAVARNILRRERLAGRVSFG